MKEDKTKEFDVGDYVILPEGKGWISDIVNSVGIVVEKRKKGSGTIWYDVKLYIPATTRYNKGYSLTSFTAFYFTKIDTKSAIDMKFDEIIKQL